MKVQQEVLINSLKNDVKVLLDCVEAFREEKDALMIQPVPGQWSITQVLAHINSYGRYYLPAIDKALCSSPSKRDAWFNSGFLGNYFTNLIRPKDVFEIKNKMKTQQAHDPENNMAPNTVIDEFIQQQHKLLELLDHAATKSLNDIKVPISVSKLVKLKLGDTFRFLIAHEQRHFIQARNALHYIGLPTSKFPVILQATPQ
jgi:hypothetical protein